MAINLRKKDFEIVEWISNEVPSGAINGINTTYVLANSPESLTVRVHLNGLLQRDGSGFDYTLSGDNIEFTQPPRTSSDILVHYIKS